MSKITQKNKKGGYNIEKYIGKKTRRKIKRRMQTKKRTPRSEHYRKVKYYKLKKEMEKLKKEAKEKRRQRKKDKYKYDTSSLKIF